MRVSASALTPGYTTLAAAITAAGSTSITVTSATGFPSTGNYGIMIDAENMTVTAGQGTTTWTVTRGVGGTTATTHSNAASVFQAATSLIPIEPIFFEPIITRYNPALMRNSFEKFYETVIVSERSELRGIKAPATFEVLTNLLSYGVKGGVTPVVSNVAVNTWTFTPTLTVDDLTGLGAEMGNDTAAYHINALYCQQFGIDIVRGNESAMFTADFSGQQAFVMGAKTPGLTRTGLNILNPAYTQTYIDTTTIGTTAFNDIASAKIVVNNGIQQLFFLNGVLYPTGVARPTRSLDLELTQWFDSATELANAMNATGNGIERKTRFLVTGPTIPTSSPATNMSLTIDAYMYWDAMPFRVDKEVWHVDFKGRSVYDVTAANSWSMTLANGVTALP